MSTPIPKVSVSITAFNHASYIGEALESVLCQETSFPVEILVGEDGSTDGTREIVGEYAARHPGRIFAFYHDPAGKLRIKGRLTGRKNLAHNLTVARGEYIALLDGDDYWSDPTKLARQVEHLDRDPTLATSFHPAVVVDEKGAPLEVPPTIQTIKERYALEEMLAGEFEAQTCTVLFRRAAIQPLPPWFFETPVGDFPLHVINGHRGDFGFIDRPMGCYRVHAGGIWTQGRTSSAGERSPEHVRRMLDRFESMVDLLTLVSRHSAARFRPATHRRLVRHAYEAARFAGNLGDKPAIRRNLWRVFRTHPWPPRIRGRILWRLLRQSL